MSLATRCHPPSSIRPGPIDRLRAGKMPALLSFFDSLSWVATGGDERTTNMRRDAAG